MRMKICLKCEDHFAYFKDHRVFFFKGQKGEASLLYDRRCW